jgi:hypothetical protein
MLKKLIIRLLLAGVGLLVLIQVVPYGRSHANPPVGQEPKWNSALTRELAVRACFDCHSNQTGWPWYSSVAPISWLIQHDVDEGRRILNFSEWGPASPGGEEVAAPVRGGSMPRPYYVPLHPAAGLSDRERAELVQGLIDSIDHK